MRKTDQEILQIALPSIVSNITVPLLGLVDVTLAGHLGAPAYIGAIAVGSTLFNLIYWIFAFLRMGTSGMTAQAWGRRDLPEVTRLLLRSITVGGAVALCFLVLQVPLRQLAFLFIHTTPEVQALATRYFHICIWGAPAVLGLYGLTGWYVGVQNSRIPMWIAIVQNLVNIGVSLALVCGAGMKIEGVALGTLIAQYAGAGMGLWLWVRGYGRLAASERRRQLKPSLLFEGQAMKRFFSVNRDIFLRTLCLVSVTLFFTAASAERGEVVMAVNALMLQLFTLYSYVMDGFAFAGEALSGRYIGAARPEAFHRTVRHLFGWGIAMCLLYTLLYVLGGSAFLSLLTDDQEVIAAAADYFPWACLIPLAGLATFVWDGIFIGATATRGMLAAMAGGAVTFFLLYYSLRAAWGNHALWISFLSYLLMRGVIQTFWSRRIMR